MMGNRAIVGSVLLAAACGSPMQESIGVDGGETMHGLSLDDVDPDGEFHFDQDGRFVLDEDARLMFDQMLLVYGEHASHEAFMDWSKERIDAVLGSQNASRRDDVWAQWQNYLQYRSDLAEMLSGESAGRPVASLRPALLARVHASFGGTVFGAREHESIERALQLHAAFEHPEREALVAGLIDEPTPAFAWRAIYADDPQAQARLLELDAKRERWRSRLDAYRATRMQMQAHEKGASAVADLEAQLFSEAERRRLHAVMRLEGW